MTQIATMNTIPKNHIAGNLVESVEGGEEFSIVRGSDSPATETASETSGESPPVRRSQKRYMVRTRQGEPRQRGNGKHRTSSGLLDEIRFSSNFR